MSVEPASVSVAVDGPVIRARRRQRGVTITELAEVSGVSRSYISKIERGERPRVSRDVLRRLAGALKSSARSLTP